MHKPNQVYYLLPDHVGCHHCHYKTHHKYVHFMHKPNQAAQYRHYVDADSLYKDVYLGRPAPFAKCKTVILSHAVTEIVAKISGI